MDEISDLLLGCKQTMDGENRPLVTYEPVEFEK